MKFFFVGLLIFSATAAWSDEGQGYSRAGNLETYTGQEPAKTSSEVPEEIKNVGIDEKTGQKIDLSTIVRNEAGQKVPLSTFFSGHKPVILSLVYYSCPGLCNFHLNGLVDVLKDVDWSPGNQYEMVALSFDANENSQTGLAQKKKDNYLKVYNRPGTENGWHFLTADQAAIDKVTQQVGFKFKWNPKVNEWSHVSAAIVVSPDGTVSRYLHGIQFEPRDVKLALNEASNGKVGNFVDSAMLFCFKYNRHESRYGLQVFRVMQLGAGLTAIILAAWLIPFLMRSKRENS